MKNKTLFLLFVLLIVAILTLTLVACQPADSPDSGNDDNSFGEPTKSLVYMLNGGGTGYYVKSIPEDDCPAEVVIASTHDNLPVVGICDYAFNNNKTIESVKIPASISNIGERAFVGCINLKTVTIAKNSNLRTIAYAAFADCASLKNIVIPDGTTSIADEAFSGCANLESITLPDSLTEMGTGLFEQCAKLQSLTIPKNVTEIEYLFSDDCPGNLVTLNWNATNATTSQSYYYSSNVFCSDTLTTVNIGDNVESIPKDFLRGSQNLTTVNFGANSKLKTIGDDAFFMCSSLTNIKLPDSLTEIGENAFYGCSSLTNIKLPNSLTEIGSHAFSDCETAFTELTIGKNITVGKYAFSRCNSITKITASYVVARSIAKDCGSTALDLVITDFDNVDEEDYRGSAVNIDLANVKNVTIDDSVTEICDDAFARCENLVSVTFGENSQLESIGSSAFEQCTALTTITLPECLQTIEGNAFKNCTALTNVKLLSGLTKIGSYAFSGCKTAFTELTFGENITLYYTAFADCTSITKITASAEVASTIGNICGSDGFEVVITSGDAVVPFSEYQGNKYYGANVCKVTIPSSVTKISDNAFTNCAKLKDVVIDKNTEFSIGWDTFSGCTSLTQESAQSLINSATSLERGAFAYINCEELTIPENLQYKLVSYSQFSGATITKLICPAEWARCLHGVNCDELVVTSGDSITIKGASAATGASIKKVTLPDTMRTICSFANCDNLTSITIPEGVTTIEKDAFADCGSLTTINLPSTITNLGEKMIVLSPCLTTINYNGTKTNWKNIKKSDGWNDGVSQNLKVYCTDGYLIMGIS